MNDRKAKLDKIRVFVDKMPSLSTTVGKVLEICSRTDTAPNDLNKVISLDPVLTGQVLKLINSAYYSLMNKVTSLTRAIIMLGLNTVKNLALSTAIIRCVGQAKKSKALPIKEFWAHSIGVGVTAKLLAAERGLPLAEREEYFVAGLLHDLGKIPFGDESPPNGSSTPSSPTPSATTTRRRPLNPSTFLWLPQWLWLIFTSASLTSATLGTAFPTKPCCRFSWKPAAWSGALWSDSRRRLTRKSPRRKFFSRSEPAVVSFFLQGTSI